MTVTQAIIPAAGLGTRLRPVTDFLPKELLPVGTKPSLFFVLEEAQSAGLKKILLVVSGEKKKLFAPLEKAFPNLAFTFMIQKEPKGLGHAVGLGEKWAGENPFMVLLPDILIDAHKPASAQLMAAFKKTGCSVNATEHTPRDLLSQYGVYAIASSEGRIHKAKGVVEKPKEGEAPSDLTVVGRYLFTPELFAIQKKTPPGAKGEIQLADAMNTLAARGKLFACEFDGIHLDVGTPLGYLKTILHYGKKEYGSDVYPGLA